MPQATSREELETEAVPQESRIGRIVRIPVTVAKLAYRNRLLTAVLTLGSLIIVTSSIVTVKSILQRDVSIDHAATLAAALAQLDAENYGHAKRLAVTLQQATGANPTHHGGALFVLGTAIAHEADQQLSVQERAKLHLVAARLFRMAEMEGLPEGRRSQGLYLHGRSLFLSDNMAASLPVLLSALDASAEHAPEIHRMLATAYFSDTEPQLKKALRHNRLALATDAISDDGRNHLWIQQAQILLAMDRLEECKKLLQALLAEPSQKRGPVLIVLGQLRMRQAELTALTSPASEPQAASPGNEPYREAIDIFQRAQSLDQTGEVTRQALYLMGVCYRRMGDLRAAEQAFMRTRRQHYRTQEAFASLLAEAEIQLLDERCEPAVESLLETMAEIGDPESYRNRWVSWYELTDRLDAAWHRLLEIKQFQKAVTLTNALKRILPEDHALVASATVHEKWGEHFLREANSLGPDVAEMKKMSAREQFRLAGIDYAKLAELRFVTPQYPDDLWKSGFNFLRGQNYKMATQLLRKFLKYCDRRSEPRALLLLGESQLALGHYEQALQAFRRCITQHSRHPATYRARLGASQVLQELANVSHDDQLLKQAKKMLTDNLHHESLTPRSLQWQDSLFALGKLLYHQAQAAESRSRQQGIDSQDETTRKNALGDHTRAEELFREALHHLQEAVQRYPDLPQAIEARYMVAQALRHTAICQRKSISFEPTQTRRNTLAREMRTALQEAAERFLQLQQDLRARQQQSHLTQIEDAILRNAYFTYGDVLFDLGDYEAALDAYSTVSNRYQHEPVALEAFVQMASCYRRTDAELKAQGTLQRAQTLLTRIPADANFTETTRYSRDEWIELLGWLAQI